jgi:pimeloyl-ACP methyl ester carboxylesterase
MPFLDTDCLCIAYADAGPRDAPAVLLLHGWPDDASAWDDVAARLRDAGFRTVTPSLRGFGETRLHPGVPRTGNSGVLALDAIALMDALGIERFAVAGHDWGSNAAEAMAVGWPGRVRRLAMLSTPPRLGGMKTPPFWHAERQWYHWFLATARGAEAAAADRRGFARRHWNNWSPPGWYDDALFDRVAASWDNPDWADVTVHSYRARWNEAEPDPDTRWLEEKVAATTTLSLPALYVQGGADGVNPPETSMDTASKFAGRFEQLSLPGIGHFTPREAPSAVAAALLRLLA